MRRRLAGLLLVLVVAGCGGGGHRLVEDEPGWNCRTMGNRVCGPVAR